MRGFPSRHWWLAMQRCVSSTSRTAVPKCRPLSRKNFESAILGLRTGRMTLYDDAGTSAGEALEEYEAGPANAESATCSCDWDGAVCGSGASGSCCAEQFFAPRATAMEKAALTAMFKHVREAAAEIQNLLQDCCFVRRWKPVSLSRTASRVCGTSGAIKQDAIKQDMCKPRSMTHWESLALLECRAKMHHHPR